MAPLFALLFAVMAPVFAQDSATVRADEEVARIALESASRAWSGRGFLPVTVKIENHMERAGEWHIRFETVEGYRDGRRVGSSGRFRLPAQSASEAVVFVPGSAKSDRGAYSFTEAAGSGPGVPGGGGRFSTDSVSGPIIAVTPAQESAVRAIMSRDDGAGSTLGADISLNICAPARWPADWRVWSPFDFVAMGADEFDALDGARRAALREWVALGGTLWLVRERPFQVRDARPSGSLGMGAITPGSAEDLVTVCRAKKDEWKKQGPHYGSRRRAGESDEESDSWLRGPWSRLVTLLDNDDLEAWEVERGTLLLVLFLIAFGIVVGPVNIYFLAPERRRHRLFLTVPAISVLASVLLGAVIVLADGFGGAGTRRALVVLMPGENKAAVFQQQVSRTGVLIGKSFAIEDDTALSREFRHGDANGIRMNREAGRADGAWFESRKRQVHSLWRVTPTRARVELAAGKNGAPPVVLSSLTTALNNFTYIDGAGESWGVEELAPGRRTPLEKLSPGAAAARFARKINPGGIERGHFYAWGGAGGASDLAPLGTLKSIRWRDDTVLYTGRVEEARGP
ncbi:hypothetical protein OH491_13870 [Termitidicoccus mucosus]|uniref:Uncharacterized protein n=1 Tax=Termitidicoccus mucosus TaxID=1184151 RepID=A0A178IGZ7_9BACT|nr:hypothetical protein AW736_13585 [Opitutaceae bacterium TSB47]